MNNLLKKGAVSMLGLAAVLAWWTIRGSDDNTETAESIPTKVYEGGGATMTVEAETSGAARMHIGFHERADDGRSLETYENIAAGRHTWTIDIPRNVGGYIEVNAEKPKVGDKLRLVVKINGAVACESSETLEEELKPNYAFFAQCEMDEYAAGAQEEDD